MVRYAVFCSALIACGGPTEVRSTPTEPTVTAPAPSERLDLNAATAEQLAAVPGMTPKMVHEFEEYRPYVSIQQFRKEIGKYVDASQVAAWEPFVYVPIDPEGSDAATLQQIDGIDASEAEILVGARPFGSRDAFLTALESYTTPGELEAGKKLLIP